MRVTDTGAGIAPEALPKIFNAFEQGSLATGSFGGLGLGLAISRAIVQMHGGRIEAESEGPGRGATFSVALRTIAAPAPAPTPDAPLLGVDAGKLRLLLVEDHDSTREVLAGFCDVPAIRFTAPPPARKPWSCSTPPDRLTP